MLAQDPRSRVAVETMITTGQVHIAGEVTTAGYVDIADDRARDGPADRLRLLPQGLRRRLLRRQRVDRRAVAGHRPGRRHRLRGAHAHRRGRDRPPGRRRPGPDVRLRHRRDPRAHAAADRAGPPARPPAVRGPQGRVGALPAPRRQDPGHRRLRGRPAGRRRHRRRLLAARRGHLDRAAARPRHPGARRRARAGRPRPAHRRLPAAGQPDRQVRHRRPDGRRRPDRPQDHRRHLRRHGPPRRRRVLRQGPVEGRPLRRLRDALGGQERRRRRPGPPLRGAGRLRDRRRAPGRPVRRDLRHRHGAPTTCSRRRSARCSTCAPARSSATSTCSGRSTRRPPPTATSAAPTSSCPGSGWTASTRCASAVGAPERAGHSTAPTRRPGHPRTPRVARVVVDVPLAHLDRPFDYAVPDELADSVQAGCRVRVRFGGQLRRRLRPGAGRRHRPHRQARCRWPTCLRRAGAHPGGGRAGPRGRRPVRRAR